MIYSVFIALAFIATRAYGGSCVVDDSQKVDCGYAGIDQGQCESQGCCWSPAGEGSTIPWCFYQSTSTSGYKLSNLESTATGYEASLSLIGEGTSQYGADLPNLKLQVIFEASDYIRVKITDADKARWEVPTSLIPRPSVTTAASNLQYDFQYTEEPFTFQVVRLSDSAVIFDSSSQLIFKDQYIQLSTAVATGAATYGIGESARLNHALSPDTMTLWARDQPSAALYTNLYSSFPVYYQLLNGQTHGAMLFNSNGMDVTLTSSALTFKTIGGIIDLYVFVGPAPNDVSRQLTSVIGKPTMMPYWSLGFHNCKYGYTSVYEVEQVVANYSAAGIPLDTQWMDIDYMEAYRDFTTDPSNFPLSEMATFVSSLHENGQHFVPIVDPGIMIYDNYPAYDQGVAQDVFIKDIQGNNYLGQVWPGPTFFPDFLNPNTQSYWTDQFEDFHASLPIDGVWIDMNEVSNFCNSNGAGQVCVNSAPSGCPAPGASQTDCCLVCSTVDSTNKYDFPPYNIGNVGGLISTKTVAMSSLHYNNVTMYDAHNLYGLSEQVATYNAMVSIRNKRPFVLSRSAFMSTGVHSAKWTGDNAANWDNLKSSIIGVMDMALFGVPMTGADICGFLDNTNEELCARWIEVGAFYPFVRDHSALNTIPQELYRWDSVAEAARNALSMRYQMLPYIYTLFYNAHTTGELVTRALWANFPSDARTIGINGQFMLGKAVLLSPVLDQGATSVNAYFPQGLWYDFKTRALAVDASAGGVAKTLDTPLTSTNVHILGGNTLPLQESAMTTTIGRTTPFTLLVALCANGGSFGSLYWDDGEQVDLTETLVMSYETMTSGTSGMMKATSTSSTYSTDLTLDTVQVLGKALVAPKVASINGVALESSQIVFDGNSVSFVNLGLKISDSFELAWE